MNELDNKYNFKLSSGYISGVTQGIILCKDVFSSTLSDMKEHHMLINNENIEKLFNCILNSRQMLLEKYFSEAYMDGFIRVGGERERCKF